MEQITIMVPPFLMSPVSAMDLFRKRNPPTRAGMNVRLDFSRNRDFTDEGIAVWLRHLASQQTDTIEIVGLDEAGRVTSLLGWLMPNTRLVEALNA